MDLPPSVEEALKQGLLSVDLLEVAYAKALEQAQRRGEPTVDSTDLLLEIQILQEKAVQVQVPIPKVRVPDLRKIQTDLQFPPYEEWEFGRGTTRAMKRSKNTAPCEDDVQIEFALAAQELINLGQLTGDAKRVRNTYQSLTDFLARIGMKKFLRVEAVVAALTSFTARELGVIQNGIRVVLERRLKEKEKSNGHQ